MMYAWIPSAVFVSAICISFYFIFIFNSRFWAVFKHLNDRKSIAYTYKCVYIKKIGYV